MSNISIVIPAYNESLRIVPGLISVIAYCKKNFTNYEIIVVDDASTDNTLDIVRSYGNDGVITLRNEKNFGKGYSVRRGIEASQYEYILFTDADASTPIEEEKSLRSALESGMHGAIGSRRLFSSNVVAQQSLARRCMGKIFISLASFLLGLSYNDYLCGFKMFRKDIAKTLVSHQTLRRYTFDAELLFLGKKLGYQIAEIPVRWEDKKGSTVRPFRDSFISLYELFFIRINFIKGKYTIKSPSHES